MKPIFRIGLFAAGALAGCYVVNELRPVKLDAASAVGAAAGGIDTAFNDLLHGHFDSAGRALLGGAKAAGGQAQDQVQGQVRANVVLGVVAGCALAGLVDALVLS
jgi:hypothetical protein